MQELLLRIDRVSTWVGKFAAWLIVLLMVIVCLDVAKRYIFNAPSAWIFDVSNFIYGTLFMLAGAYTLAQNGHVRGDFLYGSMRPRTQAALDLALYTLFFLPGIAALVYAGYAFAADSWVIREHSSTTADGLAVYPFKAVIPVAGALLLLQGVVEMVRCVVCLRTGSWPMRLTDAEEIDVIEQQLKKSVHVDELARTTVIMQAKTIDSAARKREVDK